MNNLSSGQKWALVAFATSATLLATTLFLQDNVRTFAFFMIGLAVAAYAVISSRDEDDKPKDSTGTEKGK
jgi:hypothetical protein